MRLSRIASFALLLLPALAAACEPADEGPAPATAENTLTATPDVPPPGPPIGGGAAPAQASTAEDARFASGEYALGEENAAAAGGSATTATSASASADAYEDHDPSALTDFRTTLDPYGSWVDDSTYGTVWTPSTTAVGADFVPYSTAGHWVYDDDWVWVSDYSWGWAPFHYGRWVWIDGRGWAWIPGRVYRGAWVAWGADGEYSYVGWYPAPPAFLWFGGVAVGYSFWIGPRWVYCPRGEVFSPVVGQRVVMGAAAAPLARSVRPIAVATPGVAVAGPAPQRLGYAAAQIPHASGAASAGIARAQQFARPSSAQALGAHAPSAAAYAAAPAGHVPYVAQHEGAPSFGRPGAVVAPTVPNGGRKRVPAAPPAPARGGFRGGYHGGGGFHGGAVGGGGHHR